MTQEYQDSNWRQLDGPFSRTGFIAIPLGSLRELSSNATMNIAANGGLLASDTTPILEAVNGATDSALRVNWAASNSDLLTFQTTLPPDLDPSNPIVIKFLAAMAGATNTPTISGDYFFNVGGTKRTVATGAITGTTVAEYTASIVAASIPTLPLTLSAQLTLGAHTTDAAYLYGVYITYTRK